VVDQHSDGDGVAACPIGHYLPQFVPGVDPDLTVLDLLQDRCGGEGFGDAADAVPYVRGNRTAGADIVDTGGAARRTLPESPRDGPCPWPRSAPRDRGGSSQRPSSRGQFVFEQFGKAQPAKVSIFHNR
jgi:hypothetical protein